MRSRVGEEKQGWSRRSRNRAGETVNDLTDHKNFFCFLCRAIQDEAEDERAPSMGAKSLCIPFDQPKNPPIVAGETKCVACGNDAKRYCLFGRSY